MPFQTRLPDWMLTFLGHSPTSLTSLPCPDASASYSMVVNGDNPKTLIPNYFTPLGPTVYPSFSPRGVGLNRKMIDPLSTFILPPSFLPVTLDDAPIMWDTLCQPPGRQWQMRQVSPGQSSSQYPGRRRAPWVSATPGVER